jgi:Uncharacterized protein conserved in bacteria (DUF2252)
MSVLTSAAPARRLPRYQLDSGLAHLTPADRESRGKDARTQVPRESHAVFSPSADRPDPLTLLAEQAASRLADLVPVRYGRMAVSPFAFFRGAALVMASDLAGTPVSGFAVHAVTLTCRTSASSGQLNDGSCSTSTTSTRPCPARGSGT